jgi:catalase
MLRLETETMLRQGIGWSGSQEWKLPCRKYRQMHSYSSRTYSLISARNERCWVKFHFKALQGIACLTKVSHPGVLNAIGRSGRDKLALMTIC